ncbi:MAG: efflux RND transporter periplasmic adaptor subunit, partial [Planctomycetes bacterium]|nr:efflux RND transporter periplasmic adaptor subunit [Planctomycetota bacterium]
PYLLLLASLLAAACSPGSAAGSDDGSDALEAADQPAAEADGGSPAATNSAGPKDEKEAKQPVLVRTGPIAQRAVERVLEATADVVSLDVVDVYPERTQPVVELLVEEGDPVTRGQVLARLRDDLERLAVSEAKVRLAEAKDEFARAKNDHDRDLALKESSKTLKTSLISEREFENSQMMLVTASTAREAAQVGLERAEYDLRQTIILAPIAGTVALREISLGDMANPAARAFQLVDQTQPKAIFHRPQRELAVLHVGQELTATCEAMPGVKLRGRVERISPTVDSASGTVKVTAALEAEQPIPIGVLVRLRLILARHEGALMVPKKALLYEGGQVYCYVVRAGKAVRAPIQSGFEEPDHLEALGGEGCSLLPDDQVVLVGADRLADGDPVELAEGA